MTDASPAARKNGFLRAAWIGEEPLWLVFWLYGVWGENFLYQLVYLISLYASKPMIIGAIVIYLVYLVWFGVSLWRCSNNSTPLWRTLARVYLVVSIAWTLLWVVPSA